MGLDYEVTKPIWMTICKNPTVAGHVFCSPDTNSPKEILEYIQGEFERFDESLQVVESVTEFSQYANKIEELRGKISTIHTAISNTLDYASTYQDGKQFLRSLIRIRGINAVTDPIGAAKAYGAAMTSLGRLIQKLPSPADSVGVLIAEMGQVFHQIVSNLIPHYHGTVGRQAERLESVNGGENVFQPL